MSIRLVRYLAQCGVASRRAAADLVQQGAVEVNGSVTSNMALGVAEDDEVKVHGRIVRPAAKKTILILNKPAGVVTSRSDPHNPRNVYAFIPPHLQSCLNPVGRLDKETTGLLVLTDDGDLAFRLSHPRYGVEKTYRTIVEGRIDDEALQLLEEGMMLDDGPTARARVLLLTRNADRSEFEITIHEGRNRQVRRMCEAVGFRIKKLQRTKYGPLVLGKLRRGEFRSLTEVEERSLRRCVGLDLEDPAPTARRRSFRQQKVPSRAPMPRRFEGARRNKRHSGK